MIFKKRGYGLAFFVCIGHCIIRCTNVHSSPMPPATLDLYLGKYRNPSARYTEWDYANDGYYFVTICTKDRTPFFGHIRNNIMYKSWHGMIAEQCWNDIPNHIDGVELDAFVVMPDHIHGIVVIDGCDENNHAVDHHVGTPHVASLHSRNDIIAIINRNPHHNPKWNR